MKEEMINDRKDVTKSLLSHYCKEIWIITILCILLVASGCNSKEDEKKIIDPTTNVKEQKQKIGLEKIKGKEGFYSLKSKLYTEGYYIENAQLYNDHILIVTQTHKGGTKQIVSLFDIYSVTSQVCLNIEERHMVWDIQVGSNGKIYIFYQDGIVETYNDKLVLEDKAETELIKNDMLFDKQNNLVYYINNQGTSQLYQYDLKTKKKILVYTFDANFNTVTLDGIIDSEKILLLDAFDVNDQDSSLYFYIDTKEVKNQGSDKYNRLVSGNNILYWTFDDNIIKWADITKSRAITNFALETKTENACMAYDKAGRYVITAENQLENSGDGTSLESGEVIIRVYDLQNMILIQSLNMGEVRGSYELGEFNSRENHLLLINESMEEDGDILIWDYSSMIAKNTESEDNASVNYYAAGNDKVENDKLCEDIQKKFGITIKMREQAVRFFPDFAVTPTMDESLINTTLKTLDSLFSQFPKDFLGEFKYGDIKGLEVYLCGTLVQGAADGTSVPAAFSLEQDKKQVIVIDITYTSEVRKNISHELFHAMETKIDFLTYKGSIKGFNDWEWSQLNPKGFDYHYAYVNDDGKDINSITAPEYTPDDHKNDDQDNIYFVDGYSTSYPTEDRARIFEYLMGTDDDDSLPDFFKSKRIKAKSEAIYKVLKEAFPSVAKAKQIYWERWY